MEFIKKLFGREKREPTDRSALWGEATGQSQEEQDSTRARMEEEMTGQRERRDAADHTQPPQEGGATEGPKE